MSDGFRYAVDALIGHFNNLGSPVEFARKPKPAKTKRDLTSSPNRSERRTRVTHGTNRRS